MTELDGRPTELDLIYNPSFGGYLIWACCRGYFDESSNGMPLPLAFLVLPLALHWQSSELIASTYSSSGLTLFAAKLGAHQEDLLAVHQRALAMREVSFRSLSMACAARLLVIDPRSAFVLPIELGRVPKPPESVQTIANLAKKLGGWMARLPIEQAATTLRVEF